MSTFKKTLVLLMVVFGLSACSFTDPNPNADPCIVNPDLRGCEVQEEDTGVGADTEEENRMRAVNVQNPPMTSQVVNTESDASTDTEEDTTEPCEPATYCENGELVAAPELFVSIEGETARLYDENGNFERFGDDHQGFVFEESDRNYEVNGEFMLVVEASHPDARNYPAPSSTVEVIFWTPDGSAKIPMGFGSVYSAVFPDELDGGISAEENFEEMFFRDEVSDTTFISFVVTDEDGRKFYYGDYSGAPNNYPYDLTFRVEDQRDLNAYRCDDGQTTYSLVDKYHEKSTEFKVHGTAIPECDYHLQ